MTQKYKGRLLLHVKVDHELEPHKSMTKETAEKYAKEFMDKLGIPADKRKHLSMLYYVIQDDNIAENVSFAEEMSAVGNIQFTEIKFDNRIDKPNESFNKSCFSKWMPDE